MAKGWKSTTAMSVPQPPKMVETTTYHFVLSQEEATALLLTVGYVCAYAPAQANELFAFYRELAKVIDG